MSADTTWMVAGDARLWLDQRGSTVFVFWRHWEAPEVWQGIQYVAASEYDGWLVRGYYASRRRDDSA